MTKHRKIVFAWLLAVGLAGCESMKSGAPAVNPEMAQVAAANGEPVETLAIGRRLLATRCTSCHSLEPISKYTSAQWRANVLRMAGRARLNDAETRQVTAYIVAARESL
ncbi:MAG: hypothetical protein WC003_02140 [Terrimicrobiaceae bacterium]